MSVVTRFGSRALDADGVLGLYDRHARELLGFFTRRLAEADDGGVLTDALAGLSEERIAVRARVLDERSYEAVSRELGVSQQAARARVSRGLRALRRAVAGDPEGSGDGEA